jgi:cytochrome c-type biogenesis protein CcmH/NrfF
MFNWGREIIGLMALSTIEHLVLWGAPILMLLITFGYYIYWGKEADEWTDQRNRSSSGGDR